MEDPLPAGFDYLDSPVLQDDDHVRMQPHHRPFVPVTLLPDDDDEAEEAAAPPPLPRKRASLPLLAALRQAASGLPLDDKTEELLPQAYRLLADTPDEVLPRHDWPALRDLLVTNLPWLSDNMQPHQPEGAQRFAIQVVAELAHVLVGRDLMREAMDAAQRAEPSRRGDAPASLPEHAARAPLQHVPPECVVPSTSEPEPEPMQVEEEEPEPEPPTCHQEPVSLEEAERMARPPSPSPPPRPSPAKQDKNKRKEEDEKKDDPSLIRESLLSSLRTMRREEQKQAQSPSRAPPAKAKPSPAAATTAPKPKPRTKGEAAPPPQPQKRATARKAEAVTRQELQKRSAAATAEDDSEEDDESFADSEGEEPSDAESLGDSDSEEESTAMSDDASGGEDEEEEEEEAPRRDRNGDEVLVDVRKRRRKPAPTRKSRRGPEDEPMEDDEDARDEQELLRFRIAREVDERAYDEVYRRPEDADKARKKHERAAREAGMCAEEYLLRHVLEDEELLRRWLDLTQSGEEAKERARRRRLEMLPEREWWRALLVPAEELPRAFASVEMPDEALEAELARLGGALGTAIEKTVLDRPGDPPQSMLGKAARKRALGKEKLTPGEQAKFDRHMELINARHDARRAQSSNVLDRACLRLLAALRRSLGEQAPLVRVLDRLSGEQALLRVHRVPARWALARPPDPPHCPLGGEAFALRPGEHLLRDLRLVAVYDLAQVRKARDGAEDASDPHAFTEGQCAPAFSVYAHRDVAALLEAFYFGTHVTYCVQDRLFRFCDERCGGRHFQDWDTEESLDEEDEWECEADANIRRFLTEYKREFAARWLHAKRLVEALASHAEATTDTATTKRQKTA